MLLRRTTRVGRTSIGKRGCRAPRVRSTLWARSHLASDALLASAPSAHPLSENTSPVPPPPPSTTTVWFFPDLLALPPGRPPLLTQSPIRRGHRRHANRNPAGSPPMTSMQRSPQGRSVPPPTLSTSSEPPCAFSSAQFPSSSSCTSSASSSPVPPLPSAPRSPRSVSFLACHGSAQLHLPTHKGARTRGTMRSRSGQTTLASYACRARRSARCSTRPALGGASRSRLPMRRSRRGTSRRSWRSATSPRATRLQNL